MSRGLLYLGGRARPGEAPRPTPFTEQFASYFPDLRADRVDAGHFLGEEAAEAVASHLLTFLSAGSDR